MEFAETKQRDSRIWFSAPGSKHYECGSFRNHPYSFANLSITGKICDRRCEHCNAKLLQTMIPVETPDKMCSAVDRLIEKGCRGILVSGGADGRGEVPLTQFAQPMRYARQRGLLVLAHSGIMRKEMAIVLKDCGVNQVLFDVIGHEQTIRQVYHLDGTPEDYLRSMAICREAELDFVPHVVIGLHFGKILGEYQALRMIEEMKPESLVLVILTPMSGTGMSKVSPPEPEEVERVLKSARTWNPDTFLTLGCARPLGRYGRCVEKMAINHGVNGIAFPSDMAVDYASSRGLTPVFSEECCCMGSSC
jgi:uncharacterized radical SAM superfamily protein